MNREYEQAALQMQAVMRQQEMMSRQIYEQQRLYSIECLCEKVDDLKKDIDFIKEKLALITASNHAKRL